MRTMQLPPKWVPLVEWMTTASWTLLNWTRYREWRVNKRWHGTSPFKCFLGKKLWDETKTLNILQAIAGESLNLSGLPRDFENQLTTERPGPLCSFKNANSGFIFPTVMQKTELWLPTVPSPPFYPALHPSWNSISCPSPPLLHNSSWGSYTSGSKFINFAWLPNLLYAKAFWDWNQSASWLRGTRPSSASEGMGLPKSSLGFCSMKCRKIP